MKDLTHNKLHEIFTTILTEIPADKLEELFSAGLWAKRSSPNDIEESFSLYQDAIRESVYSLNDASLDEINLSISD